MRDDFVDRWNKNPNAFGGFWKGQIKNE